jgi:hypothetical protein
MPRPEFVNLRFKMRLANLSARKLWFMPWPYAIEGPTG